MSIILDGSFMIGGGGFDYPPKSSARNTPFPDSSSTAVPPETNKRSTAAPTPPPQDPIITELMNRVNELEQKNVALQHELDDVRMIAAFAAGYNGVRLSEAIGKVGIWNSICRFFHEHGMPEEFEFRIKDDGSGVEFIDCTKKEDNNV